MTGFVTTALERAHDRKAFRSGVEKLDLYLREQAFQDIKRRVAGCFVALDEQGVIAGYYTLAATHVALDALPDELAKKLPHYPAIPAVLMGRLAVASPYQGRGLGRALVADAAIRTDGFRIGAYALIVDAKDEAAEAFYRANGFLALPDAGRRLFLPMATAVRLIDPGRSKSSYPSGRRG